MQRLLMQEHVRSTYKLHKTQRDYEYTNVMPVMTRCLPARRVLFSIRASQFHYNRNCQYVVSL